MPLEKPCTVCGKNIQVKLCRFERTKYCSKSCAKIGWKGQHRSRDTEIQKGSIPSNKLSVGTVTIRVDKNGKPRQWIKVSEPNKWLQYATYVWISENGEMPSGFILHHIDKDSINDMLGNLKLVTKKRTHKYPQKRLKRLGRRGVMTELKMEYIEMAKKRCHRLPQLF